MIIGLTGKRGVGKSTVADILEEMGFARIHAFDGGKAATAAYFQHLGMTDDLADECVYGGMKDKPNDYLPNRESPRYFMEKLGKFMGRELGVEWTLGAELTNAFIGHPNAPIVVESVVYEVDFLKSCGGKIIRVTRPSYNGVVGIETDAFEKFIKADAEIVNDGSVDDLPAKVRAALETCESL